MRASPTASNAVFLVCLPPGIPSSAPFASLFKSYLELRPQSVYVNDEYSNEGIVGCGIPLGSILGPLLF